MPFTTGDDGRVRDTRPATDLPPKDTQASQLRKLLSNPALTNPVRKPRHSLVLAHGLYGWDVISFGPSSYPKLQIHYWSNILEVLRGKIGADVIVTGVPGTGSITSRAEKMHEFLDHKYRAKNLNFIAHSMGGLDCRYLISRIRPKSYNPLSLTTICTPHRGSPFMDWCTANIGIGALREALHNDRTSNLPFTLKNPILSYPNSETDTVTNRGRVSSSVRLPSSLTTLLLSLVDSPAYGNLTTHFCTKIFNPATPDVKHVKYFSVAARTGRTSIFHPLWVPKLILTETEEAQRKTLPESNQEKSDWGNDGLVPVESAKWGEFLGIVEDCDHWDIRGAQGFSLAWERFGRSGNGGWSEFFRWQSARHNSQLAIDSGLEDVSQYKNNSSKSVSPRSHSPSPSEKEKRLQEKIELKAAFKWIASRVPTQSSVRVPSSLSDQVSPRSHQTQVFGCRFDLERFYIALCRKLYDEGL